MILVLAREKFQPIKFKIVFNGEMKVESVIRIPKQLLKTSHYHIFIPPLTCIVRLILGGNATHPITDDVIDTLGNSLAEYIAKLCPPQRLGGLEWIGFPYSNLTG